MSPIEAEMTELQSRIKTYIPTQSQTAQKVLDHVFASQGKYVRPALYFFVTKALGYKGEHLIPIAAATEYVHTASLLHDDVVDNSTLRRNQPTPSSIWGDQSAVLVGDLIYSTASEMMSATGKAEIVGAFAAAIRQMSEGELLQLENAFNFSISLDTYLTILRNKTGVLIGAACKAACLLAEKSESSCEALMTFGQNLGIAFQLIDDALDYTQKESTFGKPTMHDVVEGKFTMPLILLRDLATQSEMEELRSAFMADGQSDETKHIIRQLTQKYQTPAKTIEYAKEFTMEAVKLVRSHLPASKERDDLEKLAQILLKRTS